MSNTGVWILVVVTSLLFGCGSGGDSATQAPAESSDVAVASAESAAHPGEAVYQNYCFSCHTPGLSGAPKLGDVEAWAPIIAKGPELLLQSTIEGIRPAMPPRGMCFDCSDEDLAAAIDFMVVSSQ